MLRSMNAICSLSASILSGVMLALAFPRYDLGSVVWVALVPLLLAISGRKPWEGFLLSLICGSIYLGGIFHWILDLPSYSILHHAILGTCYWPLVGLFGFAFSFISTRWTATPAFLSAPFIWVSLEYLRSNLSFLSLPWGLLAHSQSQYPLVLQIASLSGAYGVSFLIVMVNAAVTAVAYPLFAQVANKESAFPCTPSTRGRVAVIATAAGLAGFALVFGHLEMSRPLDGPEIKVSLVQGNIEQMKKWDPTYTQHIMGIYAELTQEAAKGRPSLIVWPETAVPGIVNQDARLYAQVKSAAKHSGTYLALGGCQYGKISRGEPRQAQYLNSAFLVSPDDERNVRRYDKIRLLPFGEYLPLKDVVPWSYVGVFDPGDYKAGSEFTVFELPECRFGVTICWENLFPDIVRQFVRHGAQFIVNITNEAWFGESAAPYQFVSMSVLRAVENQIYVLRCANTGVSCIIDPYGRVVQRLTDAYGRDIFVRGVLSGTIKPTDSKTFYNRYGDWLPWLSVLCSLAILIIATLSRKRKPA